MVIRNVTSFESKITKRLVLLNVSYVKFTFRTDLGGWEARGASQPLDQQEQLVASVISSFESRHSASSQSVGL